MTPTGRQGGGGDGCACLALVLQLALALSAGAPLPTLCGCRIADCAYSHLVTPIYLPSKAQPAAKM